MTIIKTKNDFFITPFIDIPSFKNKTQFLNLVQAEMQVLESNLQELDISTFLRDAYKLGQKSFKEIINAKRNKQDYLKIHCRQVEWLVNYFSYLREIKKNNILYPYCPVLNQHPLEVIDGELFGKENLIKACTPERKKDISSSYGEGLGFLLLANITDVSPYGVLKIHNGKESTPDFIVVNKYKRVYMVSEVKSSINNRPSDPMKQLSTLKDINGLGIQVKFNSGKSPIEIVLTDPEYLLEGSIISTVYTNVTILESLLKLENNDFLKLKNPQWASNVVMFFEELLESNFMERLDKVKIKDMIVDGTIKTGIEMVDKFFDFYFDCEEDDSKGFEKIFKILY